MRPFRKGVLGQRSATARRVETDRKRTASTLSGWPYTAPAKNGLDQHLAPGAATPVHVGVAPVTHAARQRVHLDGNGWAETPAESHFPVSGGPSTSAEAESRPPDRWASSSTGSFLLGRYLYQDVLASVTRGSSQLSNVGQDGIVVEGLGNLRRRTAVVRNCEDDDVIENTAEAYRQAASIYLTRVAYRTGASPEHVDACLRLLASIPATSSMASAHVWSIWTVWPIWTAGCEAVDEHHRHLVRSRFDEMHHLRMLPSLRRVRSDIEDIRSAKDAQRASTVKGGIDCIEAIWKHRQRTADLF
ncbi:Pfam:DUF3468 [Geosmithia morbida]|uniref:Pfam:DUF3468 n=1 Tax=Geosmithia morbida TaxID=1094350 RepID=A0A9P5D1R0_9HYPO|nr:Pfam:DUF3468 [Geosmithia morbida]KAF4124203.1 Pfam:DUF3468 [Geosmithia morbida]